VTDDDPPSDPDDCPFCAIATGDAPASVLHEDDRSLAFLDVNPVTEGHALVVPRAHSVGLSDLPEGTGGHLFRVGQRVAAALRESLDPDGVNLFLADGVAAGQEVFHVHLHVVPRYEGDSVAFEWSPMLVDREELDAVAERVGPV
jgi:diadenosine tetraphosphate (Ap4A) HIT family hydrolase